ncbi:MAG TPA: presenilin family intramembrane aspartyl protease PSH [Thermoplasmata archaeon]|nr:presenilin family intramembrane aspartyl protease PSH [Thermoplasmata archaeon]
MRSIRWIGLLGLYVGAQAVGLLLSQPFRAEGFSSTSNPQSPTAPIFLLVVIVVAPLFILFFARRRGGLAALRQLILFAIAGALYFTLYATFSLLPPGLVLLPPYAAEVVLDPALAIAGTIAAALYLALLMEPQWYVVDLVGFLAAGSLIAILGISFAILPAFILLTALMVYDAIAVYRTKHMVSLADVVTDMKLPILMVMPDHADYDYTQAPTLQETRAQPVEERSALFMGLGDVVIPGTLIVSAFIWLPSSPAFLGAGANLWASVGALLGSLIGYGVLMRLVLKGNPQAGLPLLNGCAIVGYAVAYLLLFHSWTLGLTGGL